MLFQNILMFSICAIWTTLGFSKFENEPIHEVSVSQEQEPSLPTGYRWEKKPRRIDLQGKGQNGRTHYLPTGGVSVARTDAGTVVVTIFQTKEIESSRANTLEYLPVISIPDEEVVYKVREPKATTTFRSGLKVHTFRINTAPLAECDAFEFGVAVLDFEGKKKQSELARQARPAAGILPFPVVGQVMDFRLKGLDGKFVRDEDYRGRYLLIDCWASWCNPCMKKMPELIELSREHADTLSVLGINFDKNADDFELYKNKIGTPWKEIHGATSAGDHQDAWEKVSRIGSLPRLFLLNPNGELVCEISPNELKEVLARELKRP
ncbi:MAG: TlpA family protein disulfide reductase [Planctomycetaceae bacterium]|nr:TlpA family protein disulfide reductase [Planctomycetaceae bacterium]